MSFINLTSHPIIVLSDSGEVKFPPFGVNSRCVNEVEKVEVVDGVKVVRRGENTTTFLPPYQSGIYLIVSNIVRMSNPSRKDVVSPADTVRDEAGTIVSCRYLVGNSGKEQISEDERF